MKGKTYYEGIYGFEGETSPLTVATLIAFSIDLGASGGVEENQVGTMYCTLDSTPAMLFIVNQNDGQSVNVKSITVT